MVALAAKWIGTFFSKYGLPYITGYLLAGTLAGPFVFDLLSSTDAENLRFVDELSLAVIAFIAGSELYLKELQSRLRSILLNTAGIVAVAPILLGVVIFILTGFIGFTQDEPTQARFAIALLGATILLALSPASTIAIIQEVRARGDFTKTVLSITVVMDVVIIVFFAIAVAIASPLIEETGFDLGFVLALAIDLIVAVISGVLVGKILEFVLSSSLPNLLKIGTILFIGWGIFAAAFEVTNISKEAGFEIHVEPLLISMIAGFFVTNYTNYRANFEDVLHDVSPMIYVAFFTLTGVALKLDILIDTGFIAAILFLVRMGSIFVGSYIGGTLAGEPTHFRNNAWLGLITQAGIALGLAREVAVEFPTLGNEFATLIIAVVVLNEIFGPLFLKNVLRRVGEAHEPAAAADPDEVRDAVIFGAEAQSLALAQQLQRHNWKVRLVDTDKSHLAHLGNGALETIHFESLNYETLKAVITPNTDAVVTMLDDDNQNLIVASFSYEECGIKRLIVRPSEMTNAEQFQNYGALVVNPTTAMVNLLDQYVRTPQSASLFMQTDEKYNIAQVTVTNHDLAGLLVRDLRLPTDILILEISRNGEAIVPNGYSTIHMQDDVTIIGSKQSIEEVTLKLGY